MIRWVRDARCCRCGLTNPYLPPRPPPPTPALSCLHSKPQHPARHGLVSAFPKQAGPQGESNLSAFARWRRSISLLSPLRGATQNGRHEAYSPRRKPGAIPLRWCGALAFRSAAPSSIYSLYYIVYSLKSPTGGAALVYSPYYDLKLTVLYSLHDELARLVRSSTAASAVAQKIATVLYLAEAASFVYSMPPVG